MSVPRRSHGRIVTVFAGKDGYGKTTLSTNLAVTLNASGARVCLLDLDFEFGDIARWLRLEHVVSAPASEPKGPAGAYTAPKESFGSSPARQQALISPGAVVDAGR